MNGIFKSLEDPEYFTGYVRDHYEKAPAAVVKDFPCVNSIGDDRIDVAFTQYTQNIKVYSVLLASENPDHYKRSGALLHALNNGKIITEVKFVADKDWVESGFALGINYGEAKEKIEYPKFYEDYHNELLAFDLAYSCCSAYEDQEPDGYDFGYLYNVCHYLWKNKDLTVDSLAMLFRSLMHPR